MFALVDEHIIFQPPPAEVVVAVRHLATMDGAGVIADASVLFWFCIAFATEAGRAIYEIGNRVAALQRGSYMFVAVRAQEACLIVVVQDNNLRDVVRSRRLVNDGLFVRTWVAVYSAAVWAEPERCFEWRFIASVWQMYNGVCMRALTHSSSLSIMLEILPVALKTSLLFFSRSLASGGGPSSLIVVSLSYITGSEL